MAGEAIQPEDIENKIAQYSQLVYRLAFSQTMNQSDADDVYQEVFLSYIRKQPNFENEAHEKAWFIRVTINCSKNVWRSVWKRKFVALEEDIVFEQKEENDLYAELRELPRKYRVVIHLYYFEGLRTEEIAEVLKLKPSTIRTQLTRARKQLKGILELEACYHV